MPLDAERIFLNKLDDLERRVTGAHVGGDHEYEVLMAAPLLREFLFKPSIVDRVNADPARRLRIVFRCVPVDPLPPELPHPLMHLAALGFAMFDQVQPAHRREVGLDAFLKARVGFIHPQGADEPTAITVYDLVDYLANAAGGIHYEPPEDRTGGNRPAVHVLHEALEIQGLSAALYSLVGVGRATVGALQPLAEAVATDK